MEARKFTLALTHSYQLHQSSDGSLRYLLDTATGRTYTETSSGWGLHRALGEDG